MSLSRLCLKRCMKRHHRAIFLWYIAIVLNNVMVLFTLLYHDATTLEKSKGSLVYKHWLQNGLGNALIDEGMRRAQDNWLNRAANVVIKFFRRAVAVVTVRKMRASAQNAARRTVVLPRVLRDRSNTGRRGRGRPKKTKRGGGRRPKNSSSTVSPPPTHTPTHPHTHTPTPPPPY